MSPTPATITDIPIEFQDLDCDETDIDIILENNVDYIDPSNTYKKLCIRQSV